MSEAHIKVFSGQDSKRALLAEVRRLQNEYVAMALGQAHERDEKDKLIAMLKARVAELENGSPVTPEN